MWHIMKTYSHYGVNEFIICLGYKGHIIKEFFANYCMYRSNLMIDLHRNSLEILDTDVEPWKVTLIDTGLNTMTGGRIKRIQKYIGDETFMLTYGDGVSDVNIGELLRFHKNHKKLCTVTTIQPTGRFGAITIEEENSVKSFIEKPKGDGAWINGGYFVCEPGVFDFIEGDHITWEREPMERIAQQHQMMAFKHAGFWKPMDTLKDKEDLNKMWESGEAVWKVW